MSSKIDAGSRTTPGTDMAELSRSAESAQPNARPEPGLLATLLRPIASLRLTVFLFVLSLILVFFGTMAQIDQGIWTVVDQYFRSAYVWIPFQLGVKFLQVFFWVPRTLEVPGSFPFPGGWLLGALLLANLVAAHALRFKLTAKRAGIFMIHAGLILMMLGELFTGLWAIEGNMIISTGQTSNFLIHPRNSELAVVDRSDAKVDRVTVVPDLLLRQDASLNDERLPFDVRVVKYLKNSILRPAKEGEENLATAGMGLKEIAEEKPEVSGTDPDQKYDYPSAYVELIDRATSKPMGTWLVSAWYTGDLNEAGYQEIAVAGKQYDVGLRFKRSYKPYSLHLIRFEHLKYPGTNTPKDYRSTVRLIDADHQVDRELQIYMNSPLRHRLETFYQSSFLPGNRGTILQVVWNPTWWLPYLSCLIVTLGMTVHFGVMLLQFLEKKGVVGKRLVTVPQVPGPRMSGR